MTNGITYKLSDEYHWYGSSTANLNYNSGESVTTQKVQENGTGGTENVPYNGETGTYSLEANVLGLNDAGTIVFESAPRQEEIIRTAASVQATHVYFKGGTVTEDTEMIYDPETRVWSLSGVQLENSDPTTFTEKFYNGNGTDNTISNLDNDPLGKGTYKAIYISKYETGTGEPIYKLLQSQTTTLIDGKLMRTYSDYYARVIPEGLTAYYATSYDADTHVLSMTAITDGVIPANTGVLLICDPDATGINFDDRFDGLSIKVGNIISMEKATATGMTPATNYLVAEQTSVLLGPVTQQDGVVTFRNYYFAYKDLDGDGTKTLGFYRSLQNSTSGNLIRKAYLALPATVQPDASLDGVGYSTGAKATSRASTSVQNEPEISAAKMVYMLFDGEDLLGYGVMTGIQSVTSTQHQQQPARYYTLQGVEVAHPTKGIYIYQGRKIIVR